MLQSWADLIMDGLQHPNAIIGLDTSVAGPERSASNVLQFRR
jgi:hypothetical protein